MPRKEKLARIAELARELNCLQQEFLNEVETHERDIMLEDMAEEAEDAIKEEFGC